MLRKFGIIAVLSLLVAAFAAVPALAANPHFTEEPVCTLSDDGGSITCTGGKVAGLGNQPVSVFYTGQFQCETKSGSNMPPGQARTRAVTITPKGGSINLPTRTLTQNCRGTQTPVAPVTVTLVIQNQQGQTIFSEPIDVQ
jgi:hypothetical protein